MAEFVHRDDPECRVVVDVEFEAEPDADMLERLGEYAFRLRRERRYGPGQAGKYAVLSLLVNLTGAEQTHELNMVAEGWDAAGLRLLVSQATLSQEDATPTLARIAVGELAPWVLPWLPLLHGAAEPGKLALQEPDSRSRSDFGALALVFAELAGTTAVWRTALQVGAAGGGAAAFGRDDRGMANRIARVEHATIPTSIGMARGSPEGGSGRTGSRGPATGFGVAF